MQFRGYTVSYVLRQLSPIPVDYQLEEDPRIDFNYVYPELTTEEAKVVAIQALVNFVGVQAEEVATTSGYWLETTSDFGKRSAEDLQLSGIVKAVENNRVSASVVSLTELTALLNEYRSERFFVDEDACCASVRFLSDGSVEDLEQHLMETAGVSLRTGKRKLTNLRISR